MRCRGFATVVGLSVLSLVFACSDDAASDAPTPAGGSGGGGGGVGVGGTAASSGGAGTAGGAAGNGGTTNGGAAGSETNGGASGGGAAGGETNGGAAGSSTSVVAMNLAIVKNGVSFPLDRAQFGLTKLAEGHEIYVEAHFGGDAACPTESSPSPDRTVILTGLLAEDPVGKVVTEATFARANLLDFEGAITTEPILKGTAVTLTSLASNPCPTCAAGDPERFVGFAVDATLSDGTTIVGTVRATHCGSLDE